MIKIIKKLRHYTEVSINNKVYNIENEVAYKYNIKDGKEFNQDELKKMFNENNYFYYDRLAKGKMKKQTSEKDLRNFLASKNAKPALINELINTYKERKYINDSEFVNSYIEYSKKREGPNLIKAKLRNKGIKESEIDKQLSNLDESNTISKLVDQTINRGFIKNKTQTINNTKAYLINKGFNSDLVFEIVDSKFENIDIEESLMIEKEYDILLNKYKNKTEEEITLLIKKKLYEKGYKSESINMIIEKHR